jgi:DNA-directed RNA polymerase subunit beta'
VFADKLMQSGFRLATRAGISICVDDMLVPPQKEDHRRRREGEGDRQQYMSGLVTARSATTRSSTSGATSERVGKAMMEQLSTKT